jgi:hypothetical protein
MKTNRLHLIVTVCVAVTFAFSQVQAASLATGISSGNIAKEENCGAVSSSAYATGAKAANESFSDGIASMFYDAKDPPKKPKCTQATPKKGTGDGKTKLVCILILDDGTTKEVPTEALGPGCGQAYCDGVCDGHNSNR